MNIHQLSVSYDERQDRLLLRLNTHDGQEYQFWLTHRMSTRLLPAIEQSVRRLEASRPGMATPDEESKQLLADLQRASFLESADFSTPYDTPEKRWPQTTAPLLITDVQLSLNSPGELQITFQEKNEAISQACQLHLQAPLVHGLVHLIRECMTKAEWSMARATVEETMEMPKVHEAHPGYKH